MSISTTIPIELAGVDVATLRTWRTQAQTALQQLMAGTKVVEVSYSQGEGNRQVRYSMAKLNDLRGWIRSLSAAIGDVPDAGRRAIGLRF